MNNEETVKKLEKFEEKRKHEIPPCDFENNDFVEIKLNRKDAENLKELLQHLIKQLENN